VGCEGFKVLRGVKLSPVFPAHAEDLQDMMRKMKTASAAEANASTLIKGRSKAK
jgi:hypothetical protein